MKYDGLAVLVVRMGNILLLVLHKVTLETYVLSSGPHKEIAVVTMTHFVYVLLLGKCGRVRFKS